MQRLIENRWAFVPVAFLSGTVTFVAIAVTIAVRDPGALATEPDYYARGAAYDEYKHQIAENGALGWVVTPEIVASTADPRLARLELTIADKHGIPIEGAQVQAEVIPIRQADLRTPLALKALGGGRYGSDVPVRAGGKWEVRVQVRSKGKLFSDRFRRQVNFGPRVPVTASAGGA